MMILVSCNDHNVISLDVNINDDDASLCGYDNDNEDNYSTQQIVV